MPSLNSKILTRPRNFAFLLSECRGLSSKAAFCNFVAGSIGSKLFGSTRPTDPSAPDKEVFLRLKEADLWFGTTSGELGRYMEVFSGPDCNLHAKEPIPGDAILDIGANIGMFTIRYARMFPACRSYAFEPNPAAYKRLVRNLAANYIRNADAVNSAVGDACGKRVFFVGLQSILGSLVETAGTTGKAAFESEVVTLDAFCKARLIKSVSLMKINVEGAEMEVLKGAPITLETTRSLIIECHSDELGNSVEAHLSARGFDVTFKRVLREGLSVVHFAKPDSTLRQNLVSRLAHPVGSIA